MSLKNKFIIRPIKLIFALTTLLFLSCNLNYNKKKEHYPISINLNPTEEIMDEEFEKINGERKYRDSLSFHIIEGNYKTGEKYLLVYCNKYTKLDSWKEYYPNGKLKVEGIMTTSNHLYVGKWNYYSENGLLDSSVNYDEKLDINYYEAIEIGEQRGFRLPECEVTLTSNGQDTNWQITKWRENVKHSGQTGVAILINSKTGKVTKPNYEIYSIY